MSGWRKVRSLFWQSGDEGEGGGTPGPEMSDDELAALLGTSEHAVPPEAIDPVPVESIQITAGEAGGVEIDFQGQYDLAGIPDTDEVEQLEAFLTRLDPSLPKASKIAAAEAFLGAIGKDRNAVMTDAERKVKRVHGLLQAKEGEVAQALAAEQAEIDALQQRIEQHRLQMENLNRELEGVRRACLTEESRLQAARVFFGSVGAPAKA